MKAFVTVTQQQFDISAEQGVPAGYVLTQSVEFGNFIKGKDGSVIYNGSGVPANILGVNGDFYIDNVAPNNYYEKISGSWVLQGHFQGAQGEYTVITIGENGNWYIDGEDSGQRAIGIDGYTPIIGENDNWWINGVDTGKRAVGIDGVGISNWELISTVGKVKTYRITFTDSTTFEYSITDGTDGNDGREVLIQNNGTYIQWKYEGDTGWTNIIALTALKGDSGANIELQKSATHIQWRVVGDTNWIDLIALSDLKGNDGLGIVSIIKTSTIGLVDTYTITYSDSTTSTFDVTNGTSAYEIYHAGGGTLSEAEFNESITDIPTHIADATKHIDTTTAEFSGTIDETNDKFAIWDNSLLKWIRFSFTSMKTWINSITTEIVSENTMIHSIDYFSDSLLYIPGFMRPTGTTSTNAIFVRSNYVDITGIYKLYINSYTIPGSVSPAVFYDENYTYISGVNPPVTGNSTNIIEVPAGAKYMITSTNPAYIDLFNIDVDINSKYVFQKAKKIYISISGSDSNSGLTANDPILSIYKAIEILSKDGELIFLEGDYVNYKFDLSLFKEITGIGNVRFLNGYRITSATLLDGYSNVYTVPYSSSINNSYFLWQHDISDEETVITIDERHPYHNGKRTRLNSTRIYHATSISEIESTTDRLMWYLDSGNLYFSKTQDSNLSINPIIIPDLNYFKAEKYNQIVINNIEILYCSLNCAKLSGIINNTKVGYSNNVGSIIYDNCVGLEFNKCEAFACRNDGFNGHTVNSNLTDVIFNECYSHDNSDDGESCHEYCNVVHRGGLYEYNGSGITAAIGGHAYCYDSICRNNGGHNWCITEETVGSGFSAIGESIDGGIGCNIWCLNCISKNNAYKGFYGADNSSKFINCISINDTVAFGLGEQINCTTI